MKGYQKQDHQKTNRKKIEQDVNIKFQKIVDDEPNVERKKITQLEVKKAILKMKKKQIWRQIKMESRLAERRRG